MASITQVLDRLHAINQTVSGLYTQRYYPQEIREASMPLAVPWWGGVLNYDQSPGTKRIHANHRFVIFIFAQEIMAGIPTESAQRDLEPLLDTLQETYWSRLRLELNNDPLVVQSIPVSMTTVLQRETIATIDLNLDVTIRKALS